MGKTETLKLHVIAVVKIQVLISAKKQYHSAGYKECIYIIRFYIQILKEDRNPVLNIQFSLFSFFFSSPPPPPPKMPETFWQIQESRICSIVWDKVKPERERETLNKWGQNHLIHLSHNFNFWGRLEVS